MGSGGALPAPGSPLPASAAVQNRLPSTPFQLSSSAAVTAAPAAVRPNPLACAWMDFTFAKLGVTGAHSFSFTDGWSASFRSSGRAKVGFLVCPQIVREIAVSRLTNQ
jgi:hypothetical protein